MNKKIEKNILTRLIEVFKPQTSNIIEGDFGVYTDELSLFTKNDDNDSLRHKYTVKIKVIGVYTDLVEIIPVDSIKISDSTSDEITNLIQKNFPKFVSPKNISFQIKSSVIIDENDNV